MILEVAILDIKPDRASGYQAAFEEASPIIASMPGYRGHQLRQCLENAHRYLLLVQWEKLEDHTEGFRGSPEYQEWKAILHDFYNPFPVVEHYTLPVVQGDRHPGFGLLA